MVDSLWEEIVESIDNLVLEAVECDLSDLGSVIKVHDHLMELVMSLSESPHVALSKIAQRAAELAMSIVLQEAKDPEFNLQVVTETTATLQVMAREILNGNSPKYIPVPNGLGLDSEVLFAEPKPVVKEEKKQEVPIQIKKQEPVAKAPAEPVAKAPEKPVPAVPPVVKEKEVPVVKKTEAAREIAPAKEAIMPPGRYPKFDMSSFTPSHLSDYLSEMDELLLSAEDKLMECEKHSSSETIQELFGVFHTIKGVSGIIKLSDVTEIAHTSEMLLEEASVLPKEALDLLFQVVDIFKSYNQSLRNFHEKKAFLEVPPIQNILSRLSSIKIEKDLQKEELEKEIPFEEVDFSTEEKTGQEQEDKYLKSEYMQKDVKIKTAYIDALMDAVGELVIAQTMVDNDAEVLRIGNAQTLRNIATMRKITRQLQQLSMSMRMVTVQATFHTMARMVRDLASEQGKHIEVIISGEQTELDRNLIEAMYNPLVHLVRNAVDHGIESESERIKAKKDKSKIYLKAYHHGGNIAIEVSDNGKGLDRDRILKHAVEKNLLQADQNYPDDMIWQTIFLPGFSTSEQISKISGRGVGLDVVKKTIERFRGHVDVFTEAGKGTTFRISLPLTLAIIEGMLVKVDGERYIIPLINIEEFIQMNPEDISTVTGRGEVVMLRGDVVPIFRLQNLLNTHGMERKESSIGVIVSWDQKRCCLLVDELMNQQQVVIKNLGSDFNKLIGISGMSILGDGRVALILDVQNILSFALACANS
ncbi:MAG: chemotaxis protein CheA [Candidatus Brocadiae bacterium]|nr:chemotaxis protein CheA [Candidatus Brocadiia bacterium]